MTYFRTRLLLGAGLALTAALPAAAQTGLCGGVGDTGTWIGGTEAASDVATASAAMEQMALVLMRNEYVALFTVSAGTDVRVPTCGSRPKGAAWAIRSLTCAMPRAPSC